MCLPMPVYKVPLSRPCHVAHLQLSPPLAGRPSLQGLSSWQAFLLARAGQETLVPRTPPGAPLQWPRTEETRLILRLHGKRGRDLPRRRLPRGVGAG